MRIYVACLASYNAGILHGRWIDASSDPDAMQGEIDAMLCASPCPNVTVPDYEAGARDAGWSRNDHNGLFVGPIGSDTRLADYDGWQDLCEAQGLAPKAVPSAEEWAVHDYDGVPSDLGEYPGLDKIAAFVALCEEFDHIDSDDIAAIAGNWCGDLDQARTALRDDFCGIYPAFRDYADEVADEIIGLKTAGGEASQFLINYFDYEAHARDLAFSMTAIDLSAGVAVFHSA